MKRVSSPPISAALLAGLAAFSVMATPVLADPELTPEELAAGQTEAPAKSDAKAAETPWSWSGSLNASTGGVVDGMEFSNKAQYGLNVTGRKGDLQLGANITTVDSHIGTDSQNQVYAAFTQPVDDFRVRYVVVYKAFPGTKEGYNDEAMLYQVSVSRGILGVNCSVGLEYADEDYSEVRKAYGVNVSLSKGLMPGVSGWLSVAHRSQWGSVDFTNTNVGIYYQATSRLGVSTSINNWRAHAPWGRDNPTFSISLSRRL